MGHSDSVSTASLGMLFKFCWRWELKFSWTGASASCSQHILTIHTHEVEINQEMLAQTGTHTHLHSHTLHGFARRAECYCTHIQLQKPTHSLFKQRHTHTLGTHTHAECCCCFQISLSPQTTVFVHWGEQRVKRTERNELMSLICFNSKNVTHAKPKSHVNIPSSPHLCTLSCSLQPFQLCYN